MKKSVLTESTIFMNPTKRGHIILPIINHNIMAMSLISCHIFFDQDVY